jgi:hypothetical protein
VCWGSGGDGLLGDGAATSSLAGVEAADLDDAAEVEVSGYHACAVRETGGVACWGTNYYGVLGNGTFDSSFTPAPVVFPN